MYTVRRFYYIHYRFKTSALILDLWISSLTGFSHLKVHRCGQQCKFIIILSKGLPRSRVTHDLYRKFPYEDLYVTTN